MRQRLGQWIIAHRWWLYLLAVVGIWLVGTYGFLPRGKGSPYPPGGGTPSFLDAAYFGLQLFFLQYGGDPIGPFTANWALHVARFVAPGVAALGAILALITFYYDTFRLLWVRTFLRDHVLICGLGEKGLGMAAAFRAEGHRVVVVEKHAENPLLGAGRATGAVVQIGDARQPLLLRQAGLRRARHLVTLCGDDGVNAEIVTQAANVLAGTGGRIVTAAVHLSDPRLCRMLKDRELSAVGGRFRLEFFNLDLSGADAVLAAHDPFAGDGDGPPHILIAGLGALGESVALLIARRWTRTGAAGRLRLSFLDENAGRKCAALRSRVPELEKACDLRAHELDRVALHFDAAAVFPADEPPSRAYVCLPGDAVALSVALGLHRAAGERGPEIIACLSRDAGLAGLVEGASGSSATLRGFGVLDRTCTTDLVLRGTHETLARAIHQDYVRKGRAEGRSLEETSLAPWEQLDEGLRESNRRQAMDIGRKLDALGCGIVPADGWEPARFEFGPDEVETLAVMEHERWVEERKAEGWRYGPAKDVGRKLSPYLVAYGELPEAIKEYDREPVRRIPATLGLAGLAVYRKGPAA